MHDEGFPYSAFASMLAARAAGGGAAWIISAQNKTVVIANSANVAQACTPPQRIRRADVKGALQHNAVVQR